jgi:hypothetical protein
MEQGNKLIAEFMGVEFMEASLDGNDFNPQFHTSWDWLMPVVEKIESLGYEVQIRNTDCIIFQLLDTLKYKPIVDISSGSGKKDSTYKAVVEFISENGRELSYDEIISDLDEFKDQNN